VPVTELRTSLSGDVMTDFIGDAENLVTSAPIPPHSYAQFSLRTRETLCERFLSGQSPSWEEDRQISQRRGLPFPYYAPDVLDPGVRQELIADRAGFLRSRAQQDTFDVLTSLLAADVSPAVGFLPREGDSGSELLEGMCSRCHDHTTSPAFGRARFVFDAPTITAAQFQTVSQRISLPKDAPRAMPPRTAGELPPWAVERILSHLSDRCVPKGACQ
jgi:hypothetical protein